MAGVGAQEQHTDLSESPFECTEEVMTLHDIQLQLAEEELICTEDGVEVEQESTPSTFVMMGLDIEGLQRRLEIDVKALQHPSATQKLGFMKRCNALLKKIFKFQQQQLVYMPAVRTFLSDHEKQVFDGNGELPAETTWLFMPLEIADEARRVRACAVGLPEVEARMRKGEAAKALEDVRHKLRTRTMTNCFKIKNHTGQGALMRGQGAALLNLQGHGTWEERFKVLREEDVRALNEHAVEEEDARGEQLDELVCVLVRPEGLSTAQGLVTREGSYTLSWIWYTVGATAEDDNPNYGEWKEHTCQRGC
ncbi:hypothetical protein B0H17DRAFT_1214490 [Mycena rosella]|uniref:Uncharacterized protein n=1 Tax=Mycena rosella TaxID=1033263 RepID=A0AAD7CNJ4_MYCRO|nr:hypothetical protein B0H17DRAFT_1214490 [Mycena rosella]